MALVNFSIYLVLFILHQLSPMHCEESSSEYTDSQLLDESGSAAEGVRCYCNTAQCVGTGYLCRGSGCYSEVPRHTRAARHGCLHHLADSEEASLALCERRPAQQRVSLVLCCYRDLCNHEDSPVARASLNLTNDLEGGGVVGERGAGGGEGWLRAATVAVPLCGALILFLLVAVAVRLLNNDSLVHADRKLRGGYMSPLAQHSTDEVKKVFPASQPGSLIVASGRLVAVERAQFVNLPHTHEVSR